MLQINSSLQPADFTDKLAMLWELSAPKIRAIENDSGSEAATPRDLWAKKSARAVLQI